VRKEIFRLANIGNSRIFLGISTALIIWAFLALIAYYSAGSYGLKGALIAIITVVLYSLLSVITAIKAINKSVFFAQALMVAGFWVRLSGIAVIAYFLHKLEIASVESFLITLAIAYSIYIWVVFCLSQEAIFDSRKV
jgi:hypothetical protein